MVSKVYSLTHSLQTSRSEFIRGFQVQIFIFFVALHIQFKYIIYRLSSLFLLESVIVKNVS